MGYPKILGRGKIFLLTVAVGALVALSAASISAYAHSALASSVDVVMSETDALPVEGGAAETPAPSSAAGTIGLKHASHPSAPPLAVKEMAEGESLDEAAMAPYIQAALEGFASLNITLPTEGYMVANSFDLVEREITITWFPENWEKMGPIYDVTGTVFLARFTEVDVDMGSGQLGFFQEINNLGMSMESDNRETIRIAK